VSLPPAKSTSLVFVSTIPMSSFTPPITFVSAAAASAASGNASNTIVAAVLEIS
jgi:hypothetical protein